MAGLTSGGYTIPTLQEILDEKAEEYKSVFGTDFALDDDNIIWQLAQIESDREFRVWQATEQVYNSQTVNGAEGIYLDDALGLRGFYRQPSKAGDGFAVIESNNSIANNTVIPTTTNFNANNGIIYKTTVDATLSDRTNAIKLEYSDFSGTTNYDFTYINTINGSSVTVSQSVVGGNNASVTTYFEAIRASILLNTNNVDTVDVDVINPNTDDVKLILGYDTNDQLIGVSDISNYKIEPIVGTKANEIFVQATTTGFNPLGVGGITSSSPSSAGYIQVTNLEVFNSGNDVESDAVYRIRVNNTPQQAARGSRDYIVQQVSAVEDVTSVIVQANPTTIDDVVTGVPALSFETIVVGGTDQSIAQAIYDSKCITDNTSGTVGVNIVTADGTVEIINFTRGETENMTISIQFTTTNGITLSSSERNDIQEAVIAFSDTFETGKTVFNAQIQSVIFSALSINRLTFLNVDLGQGYGANFVPTATNKIPTVVTPFDFIQV